ncbi:MAG: energy transducer TonB [Acidobacteria bacterium]|nr:MAG: energy transducer TonB [Acidobacteriota bacterium]
MATPPDPGGPKEHGTPGGATETLPEAGPGATSPNPPAPITVGAAISPPELIPESRVVPVYPRLARRQGVTGTVVLSALIGVDGRVRDIQVIEEPPRAFGFGKAAVEAVKRWRYRPARRGNKPVAERITIRVVFE